MRFLKIQKTKEHVPSSAIFYECFRRLRQFYPMIGSTCHRHAC